MFETAFTVVKSEPDFANARVHFETRASRTSAALQLLWLIPMLAGLALPISVIAAGRAQIDQLIANHPLQALQLFVGLVLWTFLFGWPVTKLLTRFGARRRTEIANGHVTIEEQRMLRSSTETHKISDFDGIVHIVRTSLSGVHHELRLVSQASRANVQIFAADRIGPETIERAARAFGLPVLAANDVVRFGRPLTAPSTRQSSNPQRVEPILAPLPQAA